jgi:uncharacterized membrane protein
VLKASAGTGGVGLVAGKRVRVAEAVALGLVVAVSAVSLAGFAAFALRPERLASVEGAVRVYGWMMLVAPRAQIILAFLALALTLTLRAGFRWIVPFVAVYAISLGSELAGTTIGLPFGPYRYTAGLGGMWFDHVPALIPLSWFFMAVPSYALAASRFPGDAPRRILAASLVLLTWDLSLDPAMSLVTSYWVWGSEGPYYGMPLLNLFGWYITGVALMFALSILRTGEWITRLDMRWQVGFYGANLLLPVGMCIAAGLWGAVAATAAALAVCWAMLRLPAGEPVPAHASAFGRGAEVSR